MVTREEMILDLTAAGYEPQAFQDLNDFEVECIWLQYFNAMAA